MNSEYSISVGTRTQRLICVGCSVHYWMPCAINKGFFFKIAFAVDRHLPHFEVIAYIFTSLSRANSRGDLCVLCVYLPNVCWGLLFVFIKRTYFMSLLNLCLLNLPKRSTPWVKFYFGLSLHIFQHGSSMSLENVCDSWCMHQWNQVV